MKKTPRGQRGAQHQHGTDAPRIANLPAFDPPSLPDRPPFTPLAFDQIHPDWKAGYLWVVWRWHWYEAEHRWKRGSYQPRVPHLPADPDNLAHLGTFEQVRAAYETTIDLDGVAVRAPDSTWVVCP